LQPDVKWRYQTVLSVLPTRPHVPSGMVASMTDEPAVRERFAEAYVIMDEHARYRRSLVAGRTQIGVKAYGHGYRRSRLRADDLLAPGS
jgi:hypothetical protein